MSRSEKRGGERIIRARVRNDRSGTESIRLAMAPAVERPRASRMNDRNRFEVNEECESVVCAIATRAYDCGRVRSEGGESQATDTSGKREIFEKKRVVVGKTRPRDDRATTSNNKHGEVIARRERAYACACE